MAMLKSYVLVLPVATLCCLGCAPRGWGGLKGQPGDPDLMFQEGANRPPTANTLYSMARIVRAQGKEGVYRFVLQRIIRDHPTFLPAYCDLAELEARQSRFDAAMETLAAGLRVSPGDPILINDTGMCLLLMQAYEKSLEYFLKATTINPDDASYRANMAVALGMMGRYDESLSLYKQVVPASEAHHNLGVISSARKDLERAEKEFARARELEQN